MAHDLSSASGRIEMAYACDTPWHSLGKHVDGLATAQDMLAHAGMLYTVSTQPVYVLRPDLTQTLHPDKVPGYVAIRRDDTGAVFAVASNRYVPIQNTQAADVMDALVTEGGAHVEVAGALGAGERCWMLARIPGDFEVVREDVVAPYMLLAWGHDGKHGLAAKLTPIRVVCNNTLTAAMGGDGKWGRSADVYVRHTAGAKVNLEEARRALGLMRRQVEQTGEAYRHLAATPLAAPATYFETVWPGPVAPADTADAEATEDYEAKLERWQKHQAQVLALYEGEGKGSDMAGVRGTLWGGYNAATEWVDHVYPMLVSGRVSRPRQESVAFGSGLDAKLRALNVALEMAGATPDSN